VSVALGTLAFPSFALADSTAASNAGLTPSTALPLAGPVSGTIAGASGGAFEYLQFDYPGDGSAVTLTFTVTDPTLLPTGYVGFNLYQSGNLVGSGAQQSIDTEAATYASSTPGPILVQVFDYSASTPLSFTLTPQGLPAAPASTTTSTTAASTATAIKVLTSSDTGSLAANSGGSFAEYTYNYAGNSQVIDLTLVVSNNDVIANNSAGINVYDQSGSLVGTASPTSDPNTLSVSLNQPGSATYLVQVFNYDPAVSFTYTLTASAG
jgi:hypothetical protein